MKKRNQIPKICYIHKTKMIPFTFRYLGREFSDDLCLQCDAQLERLRNKKSRRK